MFPNVGGNLSHRIKLMKAREDQLFFFHGAAVHLLFFNMQMNKPLHDFQQAVFAQYLFPKIGGLIASCGGIALAVVMATIEGQPEGAWAVYPRGHPDFIRINREMNQGPFLEGKQQLSVVAVLVEWAFSVGGILAGKLVFQLKRGNRHPVKRKHQINGIPIIAAVVNLPAHLELIEAVQLGSFRVQSAFRLEIGQTELYAVVGEAVAENVERAS